MNPEELASTWGSARNAPDPALIESYKAGLTGRLRKEYRDFLWFTGMAVALTVFLSGGFVQYVRGGGAFDWSREWGSIVFLLLPVSVALIFLCGFVRHRQRHSRYDLSILDALRAALDANRLARLRMRVSMGVSTLAMALLPVVTHQLQVVGKQRPHEAASMLAVFGVAYAVAMGVQIWRYRRKLLAEDMRLHEMLASYERSGA